MHRVGGEGGQLHGGALGVPHGGDIGGGDDDDLIGHAGRHLEPLAQSGGSIHQAPVVLLPYLAGQSCQLPYRQGQRPVSHGCGQQVQRPVFLMGHHGLLQRAALRQHVGEIHQSPIAEPQRQIQVPQRDVAVHAQHVLVQRCQRQTGIGGEGCLTGASLAGDNGDDLSHVTLPSECCRYFSGAFLMRAKLRG